MENEKRLIKVVDATKVYNGIALYMAENAYLNDTALDVLKMVAGWLNEAPTVDAVEVVHGVWIPVTERLPEELQPVLVCLISKVRVVAWYSDEEWTVSWSGAPVRGVTHWMPLPEAPKGE